MNIVDRFAAAGLPLELRTVPLAPTSARGIDEIVQIDITREARKRAASERFRIWPGHERNRLEVLGIDGALRQLVLFVEEGARTFNVRVPARRVPHGAVVVGRDKRGLWIEQRTSERARHFLCGLDEQHLFIALLPEPVPSVREAHEVLVDPRVRAAERTAPEPTVRQGEWFFVALSDGEAREVELLSRHTVRIQRRVGIAEAAGIRRLGRPHVVDELIVVDGIPDAEGDRARRVYVRGGVRHPDHRTVVFPEWRRTIPNREAIEQPIEGVHWID